MEDQLAYLIASINHQLEEELMETLKPEGIAIEQFRILSTLASSGNRSMRDLAGVVLIDPASLTKIVDRMVAEALVYRTVDPNDRRKVLISLATKGRVVYDRLKDLHTVQQRKIVGRLSEKDADRFATMLRGLMRP